MKVDIMRMGDGGLLPYNRVYDQRNLYFHVYTLSLEPRKNMHVQIGHGPPRSGLALLFYSIDSPACGSVTTKLRKYQCWR